METIFQLKNLAFTNIVGLVDISQTSITVEDASLLYDGSLGVGKVISAVIWNSTDYEAASSDTYAELVKITAITGNVLTVSRGQYGTIAKVHNISSRTYRIAVVFVKDSLEEINTRLDIAELAITNLGTNKINNSEKGAASGVATLDSDGKLTYEQLPSIAITNTFVVASEVEMLALSTAETGDVAIRTDENKSYILTNSPASTLSNWELLRTPTDTVLSVNGKTGAVTLNKTDVGLDDASVFKGAIDLSTNPNYPAGEKGDLYYVSVSGRVGGASGKQLEVNDFLYCITDSSATGDEATVGANWKFLKGHSEIIDLTTADKIYNVSTVGELNAVIANLEKALIIPNQYYSFHIKIYCADGVYVLNTVDWNIKTDSHVIIYGNSGNKQSVVFEYTAFNINKLAGNGHRFILLDNITFRPSTSDWYGAIELTGEGVIQIQDCGFDGSLVTSSYPFISCNNTEVRLVNITNVYNNTTSGWDLFRTTGNGAIGLYGAVNGTVRYLGYNSFGNTQIQTRVALATITAGLTSVISCPFNYGTSGILVIDGSPYPKLTTTERDALPVKYTGNIIYNSSLSKLEVWNGSAWTDAAGSGGGNYVTVDTVQTITGAKTFDEDVTIKNTKALKFGTSADIKFNPTTNSIDFIIN